MNQGIKQRFETLAASGRKALVCYLTGGDPDLPRSRDIAIAACRAGVDVLELGIPFSDPSSDGPAIQEAAQRALRGGATLPRLLTMVRDIRANCDTPIVLFGYYNPFLRHGLERLCREAAKAGANGLLVVDLPPEESGELEPHAAAAGLDIIRLVAPTTPPERMRKVAEKAGGFLYLITRTGVTGGGKLDTKAIAAHAAQVKSCSQLPVCLGFGISHAEDARRLAPLADGIVIGSAFIKRIAAGGGPEEIAAMVGEFRRAIDSAGGNPARDSSNPD